MNLYRLTPMERDKVISDFASRNSDTIIELAQAAMFGDENPGLCILCGAERDGCEPDARWYPCDNCGASESVFGASELTLYIY